MTIPIRFQKKLSRSGNGWLIWLPKKLVDFLSLDEGSYVEMSARKTGDALQPLMFTKRVARSGRSHLVWVPKDVTELMEADEASEVEFTMRSLTR
jgi:hypothetical protein